MGRDRDLRRGSRRILRRQLSHESCRFAPLALAYLAVADLMPSRCLPFMQSSTRSLEDVDPDQGLSTHLRNAKYLLPANGETARAEGWGESLCSPHCSISA
jgi:hypothetical protein